MWNWRHGDIPKVITTLLGWSCCIHEWWKDTKNPQEQPTTWWFVESGKPPPPPPLKYKDILTSVAFEEVASDNHVMWRNVCIKDISTFERWCSEHLCITRQNTSLRFLQTSGLLFLVLYVKWYVNLKLNSSKAQTQVGPWVEYAAEPWYVENNMRVHHI